jgi:pimeloyl-ACP methyl ester carboxylesterase
MTDAPDLWQGRGGRIPLVGHEVFVIDIDPVEEEAREPLLVLHGFPTSSFDFHLVADGLARDRRVVLFDMVGYGLSAKPDLAYTVDLQADVTMALVERLGLHRLSLLTHDYGDTVGGELLARHDEGRWQVEIVQRVLTNGSIFISMAHLSIGQELLLSLPDQRLTDGTFLDADALAESLAATFAPNSSVSPDELADHVGLIMRDGGQHLLPRTIRYIEERRQREERFTGAIEVHASPLAVVWGTEDPIAVVAMVDHLMAARPETRVEILDGVGHYPMIEAPERFLSAVLAALAQTGPTSDSINPGR